MAEIKLYIESDQILRLLGSDRALAELLERVLNQVLEAELTEHNGRYTRQLTTRVGTLDLHVPRDGPAGSRRSCYRRSEQALVLS